MSRRTGNNYSGARWQYSERRRSSGPRANKYAGECCYCGETVAAGGGLLERSTGGQWLVKHRPAEWAGSPVSGRYVGGCPAETERLNERLTEARS